MATLHLVFTSIGEVNALNAMITVVVPAFLVMLNHAGAVSSGTPSPDPHNDSALVLAENAVTQMTEGAHQYGK